MDAVVVNNKTRHLAARLEGILKTRPIAYLNGPRQTGKTTLAQMVDADANYVSFDSPVALAGAKADPAGFVNSLPSGCLNIIDEVQMAPEIFPYLKMAVDRNRPACKYLLTGSADVMALPVLSEALVGRMAIMTLLPFSTAEYLGFPADVTDALFDAELTTGRLENGGLLDGMTCATFPEMALHREIDRTQWLNDYIMTLLQRDVRALAEVRRQEQLFSLLSVLSMRAGGLLNDASVHAELGMNAITYQRYKALLIHIFLLFELRPWMPPHKLNKRFTKSPKLYFHDTNILTYLMRRNLADLYRDDRMAFGRVFENYVVTEIMKHASGRADVYVSFFRLADGTEADIVLERPNGDIVGIEVKASESATADDAKSLSKLKTIAGDRFKRGLVIYAGTELVPLGANIWAMPAAWLNINNG
ncbi:MAG: ATP-binding protein [Acidobacteria bacterium]|nr:ATP-binding protein [Acidobacteriota bacterium]